MRRGVRARCRGVDERLRGSRDDERWVIGSLDGSFRSREGGIGVVSFFFFFFFEK